MKRKLWSAALLSCVAGLLVAGEPLALRHLSGAGHDASRDGIRFTDRAEFDPKYRRYFTEAPVFLVDWEDAVVLPGPPANSSSRTEAELRYLRELESKRTNEAEEDIMRESKVVGMRLGEIDVGALLAEDTLRPATRKLLLAAMNDMEIIVFRYKARFDRPRPSHLDAGLAPCISVPGHPAYPSGHATQAHLLAYLLSELDPERAGVYLESAAGIARNREIAGVHYPSDSEAGRSLARQIADRLMEIAVFRELLEAARKEWR